MPRTLSFFLSAAAIILAGCAVPSPVHEAHSTSTRPSEAAAMRRELFDLADVRLLDGPLARGQEINRQYLLKLDPDRLLSYFRREAGLEPKAPPYRGWESESPNLTGHMLGFYMSGAARWSRPPAT